MIEDKGARALAEALKTNTTLTKLHVGGGQQKNKHTQERGKSNMSNQTDMSMTREDAERALRDALLANTALTMLDLTR